MVPIITQFILSALVIMVAGIFLTRSADQIAEITKLGRLLVGSIFLAAATSLPELFVDISAIRNNMPDLAVGDLFGSSLFNLLILAIADLLHKGSNVLFSRAAGAHALAAAMSVSVTAIAGMAILLGPQLTPYAVGNVGLGTLSIVVAYILGLRMIYFDQRVHTKDKAPTESEEGGRKRLPQAVALYLASALAILIAAPFLAEAAGGIAEKSGLGKTFVGTTLVAFCTSLPELVSTVWAVRMGAFDLALGNIFGSNAFNMILLAPLDLISQGPLLASVSRIHGFTAFATILITSVAVMGQLYQVEKRKRLVEPDAMVVIFLVFGALFMLYVFRDI